MNRFFSGIAAPIRRAAAYVGNAASWLTGLWNIWVDARPVLSTCRFSIFVLVAGGAALSLTAQGQEILIGYRAPGAGAFPYETFIYFQIAVAIWAVQSWYWPRLILNFRFGRLRHAASLRGWLIRWTPRAIGLAAYGFAFASLAMAGAHWLALVVTAAFAAAFGVFAWKRTLLFRRHDEAVARTWERLPLGSKVFIWSSGVLSVTGMIVFTLLTVDAAFFLGSGAVVFLALGLIVPAGSYLVYKTRKHGLPVITWLLLAAVLFSVWMDNHGVRRLPGGDDRPDSRPTVQAAADGWWRCVGDPGLKAAPVDGRQPLVVVATAGGALRAALWTATVLAEGMTLPNFRERLFAISAVSGGSVGAAFATAHLREPAARTAADPSSWLKARIAGSLTDDYVAPVMAGLLFADLAQRFWPFGWFPDRAAALERGWEEGWRRNAAPGSPAAAARGGLDGRFRDFSTYAAADGLTCAQRSPVLLFNGTHEETGKRLITANVRIAPEVFLDAFDFFDLAAGSIRLSTAAHNSARFTYISPAGTLYGEGEAKNGHVLDGGYFENFGAVAALELLRAIPREIAERIRPIVILISSDPDLARDAIEPNDAGRTRKAEHRQWINEIFAPPVGLYATRSARGVLAAQALKRETERMAGGVFLHFRMCEIDGLKPGLGWSLSPASQELIREKLISRCGNREVLQALKRALGGDASEGTRPLAAR